ncbi:alpha/beta hydrolase [Sphingobium sp. BHU LFT2]|uniref:alpha/beta fold hydrolase n=1 Tax=Sphingobium sp. BHU LFT2 TaxID=2807634 RepID=UPI001BEC5E2A|nr:alpha/beta hydrolase [Sphingobium sp. BHU LFT2]MBT2246292.1 alpha/beta hydrolase [Sphingobium sp. BHU LFT2]
MNRPAFEVIRTDVLEIACLQGGPKDGYPLMLLHGWPDDVTGWKDVTPALEAAGYRWIAPWLRGFGETRFRSERSPRDGSTAALARDALDLADALGFEQFSVVGHDWGGRAAYAMAALAPKRLHALAVLAIGYSPRGRFEVPSWDQSARWWYQWLMTCEAGVKKIEADPIAFARWQWDNWSPPGWFDETDFVQAAQSFRNPDWLAITLHGYRHRWQSEPLNPRYSSDRARIEATEKLGVATLMIQGGEDHCDPPSESEDQASLFLAPYQRLVLDGVGHFPAREAPAAVTDALFKFFKERTR